MGSRDRDQGHRYVNDLRRLGFTQGQVLKARGAAVPIALAIVFLGFVAAYAGSGILPVGEGALMVAVAAAIGGYMALNIGANDVANNMGSAVGGRVLTVTTALILAAICECAGALLAGGDVVKTVASGIITPGDALSVSDFRLLMLSALLAAALWINIATMLNAPVSTHPFHCGRRVGRRHRRLRGWPCELADHRHHRLQLGDLARSWAPSSPGHCWCSSSAPSLTCRTASQLQPAGCPSWLA